MLTNTSELNDYRLARQAFGMLLNVLALPIKKTLQHPKADQEKRSVFCQTLETLISQKRPIVFIDESGFAHGMPRSHGYATKGKRCYGKHDWGAKGRTNVIGALLGKILLTVTLVNSSINALIFNAWVEQDLIPKLPSNSVVVMDNATFHKSPLLEPMITAAGHQLLYLPPYSPDLNPIEKKWAQAKNFRRKSQCTLEELFLITNI
jgi:transposase